MLHLGGAVLCGLLFLLPSQAPASCQAHQAELSVHVLNVVTGLPGRGLAVQFSQGSDDEKQWKDLYQSTTNEDGRLSLPQKLTPGTYKVRFNTGAYWQQQGHTSFFPYAEVVFTVTGEQRKVHIPLLLSPYSYTTYRGS